MRSPVQAAHKCSDDWFPNDIHLYQINELGDPQVYLSDLWCDYFGTTIYKGFLLKATHNETGVEYFYEAKEYKDGWWKLEWPD